MTESASNVPEILPVLPLRDTVVLPTAVVPLAVGQERSLRLVDALLAGPGRHVLLVRQSDAAPAPAGPADVARTGVVAVIHQARRTDGGAHLVVQGLERVRIAEFAAEEPWLAARFARIGEAADGSVETDALAHAVREMFARLVAASPDLPDLLAAAADQIRDPAQTSWFVAAHVPMTSAERQELLETDDAAARLRRLADRLRRDLAVREVSRRITAETEESIGKAQREAILREQMRTIRRELGDDDDGESVADALRTRLADVPLPPDARREADRELARLGRIPAASPEHGVLRTWLEWMAELPWGRVSADEPDAARARAVLDEDHHGLADVKERLTEALAVRRLRRERADDGTEREPVLCLVGPPGVGKTSLAQSIGRALGRPVVRIALGGVHDESEIRGHRRTYVAAMPGRVLQAVRRAGAADAVIVLDEVDKLGRGFHGDPSAALLELLDPAQNHAFTDSYLGTAFDLSRALFVCTANTTETIPAPLLDRMEVLSIAGYSEDEKLEIARRHVVPRQTRAAGLRAGELALTDAAIRDTIRLHTREAGVRHLEQLVGRIARRAAMRVAGGATEVRVDAPDLEDLLGRAKVPLDVAERIDRPGVSTGLAWTPAGGDVLFVEATATRARSGRLVLTGSLGDVMRESAQAALTFLRSRPDLTGTAPEELDEREIHVHVPGGAVPKDGPSAGVAIAVALASAMTGRVVRHDVAMTGEITLRGKVLPVGGVKEKLLAAHRAGVRTVLLPRWNVPDADELPERVRDELRIVAVDTVDEALAAALPPVAGGLSRAA